MAETVDPVPVGTVVVPAVGTAVVPVVGTAVVPGTVEEGHILAVGVVAVREQTEGEQAGLGQSRASELHFDQILGLEVRTEGYRSLQFRNKMITEQHLQWEDDDTDLRVAWLECWGRGNLEESDPSPSFSEPPSVSPAQTGGILPQ